jgi:hypothetical protein
MGYHRVGTGERLGRLRGRRRLGDDSTPTPNALNLMSDTPLTLDPNAAAIVAEQAAAWVPDANAGANQPSGSVWSGLFGGGSSYSPASSLTTTGLWVALGAAGILAVIVLVKK